MRNVFLIVPRFIPTCPCGKQGTHQVRLQQGDVHYFDGCESCCKARQAELVEAYKDEQ